MAVDFGLQGQVAIVTGSTSGIGHAMADALAAQGCNIVMNGLGEMNTIERARAEMAETHGVEVLYHGADMTKPIEIADMVRGQFPDAPTDRFSNPPSDPTVSSGGERR